MVLRNSFNMRPLSFAVTLVVLISDVEHYIVSIFIMIWLKAACYITPIWLLKKTTTKNTKTHSNINTHTRNCICKHSHIYILYDHKIVYTKHFLKSNCEISLLVFLLLLFNIWIKNTPLTIPTPKAIKIDNRYIDAFASFFMPKRNKTR